MRIWLLCLAIIALGCILFSIVSPVALTTQSASKEYVSNIHNILTDDLSIQKNDLVCLGFNLSSRREPWVIFEYLPAGRKMIDVKFNKTDNSRNHQEIQQQLQSVAESCGVSLEISMDSEIGSFRTQSYTIFRVIKHNSFFLFYAGGL